MPAIPRDREIDGTLALLRDPYGYIGERCRRNGSDVFQTRLLLRQTVCMTGPAAARLVYDQGRFVRQGAMPGRILATLIGHGGVQTLDGRAHCRRKQLHMLLMTPDRVNELAAAVANRLRSRAREWSGMKQVVLRDELPVLLTRAVCRWSGVPLGESEAHERARQLSAMFLHAGSVGPKHWGSRLARRRAEGWLKDVVERERAGKHHRPETNVVGIISRHKDEGGVLLDARTAAVELLNVLRPTVAIAVYIAFVAHALHVHPESRTLACGDAEDVGALVDEIRRSYPFFPAVAAVVRRDFEWNNHRFASGTRVLLDLYGTNHDPGHWSDPEVFRPARFKAHRPGPFTFVPQGGGDPWRGHRCAGEAICIAIMKSAARFLAAEIKYDVPKQDLQIDRTRLPAEVASGFVMTNVTVRS